MKRWHEELPLMVKRAKIRRSLVAEAFDAYGEGLSRWRKRDPRDCGRTRCGCCHGEKFSGAGSRSNDLRSALRYEDRAGSA